MNSLPPPPIPSKDIEPNTQTKKIHTEPSAGIHILTRNELNSSASNHLSTTSFNNLIKHIKKGNIQPDHTLSPTPDKFKIKLKLHQQRTLYEMLYKESIDYRVSNSINMFVLSDKVGSGKSIDILALIAQKPYLSDTDHLNINRLRSKSHRRVYRYKGLELQPTVIFKTNLIIIPHNIFKQWEQYIRNCTYLSVYTINMRHKIKHLPFEKLISGEYPILLVKSTMYNDLMQHIYEKYPGKRTTLVKKNNLECYKVMQIQAKKLNEKAMTFYKSECMHNNNDEQKRIIEEYKKLKKYIDNIDINDLVTNVDKYTKQVDHIQIYKGPLFERVIFDEANSIKISNCEYAYGKINWFITSSVEDLLRPYGMWQNNAIPGSKNIDGIRRTGFIRDMFAKNANRGLFDYIQDIYIKNKDEFVDKSFNLPDPIKHIIRCWTPDDLKVLQGIAIPAVIQALNAGDTKTAISLTNCNISNETSIVDKTLSYLLTKLSTCNEKIEEKNKILDELEINLTINVNVDKDIVVELKKKIKNCKKSLQLHNDKKKDIEFKLTSLKERISNIKDKICPICRDVVSNPCLTDCCKNIFCMSCFITALSYSNNKQCPHCREPNRVASNLTLIDNNSNISKQTKPVLPIKHEKLISLIQNKPDGKFLVFSQYSNSFNLSMDKLSSNNIPFEKLSGSSGRVTNIIDKFSNDKIKVLLLNANHFGSGLNLEMTTDIIIYHKMSAELEEQVIGRGQRLGRTGALHIHYLYYEHEN